MSKLIIMLMSMILAMPYHSNPVVVPQPTIVTEATPTPAQIETITTQPITTKAPTIATETAKYVKPTNTLPTTTKATATTPTTGEQTTVNNMSYANQVVDLVNVERAKEGLAPLSIDTKLESAALVRTQEIQTNFSHTRPNGTSCFTVFDEQSIEYHICGENIAWGQRMPEEVVNAWMNSPGHRANIMNPRFTKIGVGNLKNNSNTQYWTQLFTG